jgi:Lrp/AsnC family transcriptional regulator for asnA, asnC and gidA
MYDLDDLDRRILVELQADGRRSYREIAKTVGVAPGTVATRVQQMTSSGLLSVIAIPNLHMMGFKFHALVGVKVEPGRTLEVARALESEEEVTWVGLTATGYDLLVEVAVHDAQEFGAYKDSKLAHLPGFVSADVFVYWDLLKQHYRFKDVGTLRAAGEAGRSRKRAAPRAASIEDTE